MKTSSSRFSHRPDQRYANSGQIQGGMVTDADLVEAGQLHQARDEAQSSAIVRSGTPSDGGIVDFKGPALREGTVFAQGKQGHLEASAELSGDPLDIYLKQADLPLGPSGIPEGDHLFYADLWDRTIRAQQDSYLADDGLHGAETSFRTRTMVQLKALPEDIVSVEEVQDKLDKGVWPFCATGNAAVKLTKKNITQDAKTADPCADKITAEREVPNALWRIEAIDVKSDPKTGKVESVTLAWSLENAAGLEHVKTLEDKTAREAFERDTAVYEFLSEATECQIGTFPDGHAPERPVLSEQLHPAANPKAGRNGGKPFDLVRRWDGAATFAPQGNAVSGKLGAGNQDGVVSMAGGTATIDTDAFTLDIDLEDMIVLAGDYWLIELRRFAAKDDQLRLINDGAAIGPRHHFCLLIRAQSGDPAPLTKEHLYRLDFPSLTSLNADRVSFAKECDDLYGDAETVQEALGKICDIKAEHVGFEPPDNCERFTEAGTVQEALERLCTIEDSLTLERYLRLTADWGVLCGIDVTLKLTGANGVKWSSGTMLDRKGRIIDVDPGSVNLLTLPEDQIIGGSLSDITNKSYWVCFALAAKTADGPVLPYLCDPKIAFGPSDLVYKKAFETCQNQGKIDLGAITDKLKDVEMQYLDDTLAVWNKRGVLAGSAQLDDQGGEVMQDVTTKMMVSYLDTFEGNEKVAETQKIERLFKEAETKYSPNRNAGISENVLRMNQYATKIGILALSEKFWKDNRTCDCRHKVVPCMPDAGEPPYLVPVGGVHFEFNDNNTPREIQFFDPFGLRKQAMTWRSYRYFMENFTPTGQNSPGDNCWQRPETRDLPDILIPPVKDPNPGLPPWVIDPDLTDPINPKWPPRDPIYTPKDPIYRDPGFVTPILPDIGSLKVEAAKDALQGSGFTVADVVDTGSEDALAKYKDLQGNVGILAEGKTPKPGDTVALITSGGNAIDYVLISEGAAKQPFETTASLKAKLEEIGFQAPKDGATPGATKPTAPDTKAPDLSGVKAELDEITKAKDTVSEELSELSKSRESLLKAIEDTRAELVTINQEREDAQAGMQDILKGLEDAKKEQANMRLEFRRETPVDAVLGGNDAAVKALREAGVVSMRDTEKLTAGELTQLLRRGGVTNVNGSGLKTSVNTFIKH